MLRKNFCNESLNSFCYIVWSWVLFFKICDLSGKCRLHCSEISVAIMEKSANIL